MGSCNCGGKTVKFKKATITKATIKKGVVPMKAKSGSIQKEATKTSAMSKALSAKATKAATAKANKNAKPCNCTQ